MEGLELLKFSWFGGEPLVAKDVVLRLSRYAKQKCDEHGVKFQGGLTTNAYVLDQALARELISLNQDFFQITLDGWKEAHDVLRQRADGRGTFDVIWNNLLGLKALDLKFEVCVRIHVRRDNIENLETLMREYAKEFFDDKRFRLDFQHLRDMGGDGGKTIQDVVTLQELNQIEKKLRKIVLAEMRQLRGRLELESCVDTAVIVEKASNAGESAGSQRASEQTASEPYICYASKANSLLIRSNGRIGKCTVAFDDDRNHIGVLLPDGKLSLDTARLNSWFNGIEDLDEARAGCPIGGIAKEIKTHKVAFVGKSI
jgi:uncharacterized protein